MTPSNYDSDFCGSLPIQFTNSIQPHGVLVIIDRSSGTIIQASENAGAVFGKTVKELVGTAIGDYVSPDQRDRISKLSKEPARDRLPLTWTIGNRSFLSLVHIKETFILAEIELLPYDETGQDSFVRVFQEIKFTMSSIESATSVQEACDIVAAELKRISGFDKIMVYKFDEQWNGTVITELLEPGMESYMGFTFPASDIPRQARQLYLKNPYRLIPDRSYQPVKLYPVINPTTNAFLDLSDCNLRSVPAVHLEYLKNMGVVASMSVRILQGDKLWGLIACHHRTPMNLSYQTCSIFEMLSTMTSSKITLLHNQDSHAFESSLQDRYTQLIEETYRTQRLEDTFLGKDGLLELFNATGAVISTRGKVHHAGKVPSRDVIDELILWLHTRQLKSNYHTTSLQESYDLASSYPEVVSGVLIIPINFMEDEYIMLFRPEVVKVINWGGNPDERIQFEKDEKNYHPRNSFKQWQQKVSGTSTRWKDEEIEIAEKIRGFIFEYRTANPAEV